MMSISGLVAMKKVLSFGHMLFVLEFRLGRKTQKILTFFVQITSNHDLLLETTTCKLYTFIYVYFYHVYIYIDMIKMSTYVYMSIYIAYIEKIMKYFI